MPFGRILRGGDDGNGGPLRGGTRHSSRGPPSPVRTQTVSKQWIATLRRVPLFQELTEGELAALAANVSTRRYAAGRIIFSEGDPGGDVLIVHQGAVRIVRAAPNGRQQLLAIERAGSSLGEVSVFDGGPYSATAIADSDVEVLAIRGAYFRSLCESQPRVAARVIRVLGHRLRRLRDLVEELSRGTVRDRLITHLLRLAEQNGTPGSAGIEINLEENNEELAARLGTVREIVSRNLGRLHGEGLLRMRRRAITIPDLEALRRELGQ